MYNGTAKQNGFSLENCSRSYRNISIWGILYETFCIKQSSTCGIFSKNYRQLKSN